MEREQLKCDECGAPVYANGGHFVCAGENVTQIIKEWTDIAIDRTLQAAFEGWYRDCYWTFDREISAAHCNHQANKSHCIFDHCPIIKEIRRKLENTKS